LVERPDLQIVDTELFEMAQRIHQTRITVYEKPDKKTTQARFQGIHKYAGKIFCPDCGKPYHFGYADRKKTYPIYRIEKHKDCPNPVNRIDEADIEEITKQALKRTIDQQNEVCQTLEAVLSECVEASQNTGKEVAKLKQQLKTKNNQLNNLIDQLSEGGLIEAAKEHIKTKINTITEEIENLTEIIKDKEANKLSDSYVSDKIAEIKSAIAELRNFTEIDRDRILNYIERIELPANGDVNILLKSGQVITIAATENMDFSMGDSVVKNGKQDVRYSLPAAYPTPPLPAPRPQ
jgi:DNA repair exonuclease SbcCD ATPase subunit